MRSATYICLFLVGLGAIGFNVATAETSEEVLEGLTERLGKLINVLLNRAGIDARKYIGFLGALINDYVE